MTKDILISRPYDEGVETTLLGTLLSFKSAMLQVCNTLRAEMFYVAEHQELYSVMEELHDRGEGIDIITVTDGIRRRGQLDKITPYQISSLSSLAVSTAHLEYHLAILVELYMRRECIQGTQLQLSESMDLTVDLADVLDQARRRLDLIENACSSDSLRDLPALLESALHQAAWRMENHKNGLTGIPTGLEELDKLTGGFQNGEAVFLAGRPGMGKTAVSLRMAWAAGQAGFNAVYYRIEMSGERLMDRWIVGETGIDPNHWKNGQVTEEESAKVAASLDVFRQMPIRVDDNPKMSMDYIFASSRVLRHKGMCDIVFVDYLQLSDMKGTKLNNTRAVDVGEATRKAKLMAKKLNVPVVLLSQLNRKSEEREDKRPELHNLRESGNIEQDADLVLLLHSPEKSGLTRDDRSGFPVKGLGVLIVAKNRNGQTGDVYFGYNESMTRIADYVPPVDWMAGNAKRLTAKELRERYGGRYGERQSQESEKCYME